MFLAFLRALGELPRTLRTTPQPRLIMTLLVKNEAQLLEHNLRFHRMMGVDGFIITNNNSTDGTADIIARYQKKGWVLEAINEPGEDYQQKRWVHRMVLLAKEKYGADWVINADGDEFWYAPTGSLKDEISATRANVLRCEVVGMRPQEHLPFDQWQETAHECPIRQALDLSPYGIFGPHPHKVMHRTASYVQIAMGNHKVKMMPQLQRQSTICIYHYNHLGREAFVRKVVNGGEQLERNPSRHGGRHWRYFLDLYRQGRLEAEYDRIVGTHCETELRACGAIRRDDTMVRAFAQLETLFPPEA